MNHLFNIPSFLMPKIMVADNVSELNRSALSWLDNIGKRVESRNGPAVFMPRAEFILTNPRNRYLDIPERKSNIFQIMAETFWIMSGDDKVKPFLEFFLPRAVDFSDDGETWRGGYGPRIFKGLNGGQFDDALGAFLNDGVNTRRAVISIYNPDLDSSGGLFQNYGLTSTKDLPCNDFIQFWGDETDMSIHMEVYQRSGDLFWGTGSINLHEFSFLHELFVASLNSHGCNFKLGSYRHLTANLHFYPEKIGNQAENMLKSNKLPALKVTGNIEFGEPVINPCDFFEDLVKGLTNEINGVSFDLGKLFNYHKIPTTYCNTLFVVATVVQTFIRAKVDPNRDDTSLDRDMFQHHRPLLRSIEQSKFKNFEIV